MQIKDIKAFDQKLNLIFHAVLAGPLVLYCFTYLEALDGTFQPVITGDHLSLKLLVAVISGLTIFGSLIFYKTQIKKVQKLPALEQKLAGLFKATVIQYAILEVGQLMAAIGYFLTLEHIYTAVYVTSLFLMSFNRPSLKKYSKDLSLKGKEREILINKNGAKADSADQNR